MKRVVCFGIAFFLFFWTAVSACALTAFSGMVSLSLPVTVEQTGREFSSCEVVLSGDIGTEPMPDGAEGTCTLEFEEAGTKNFPEITFTEPGEYGYTLRLRSSSQDDDTWDLSAYHLKVYVSWSETRKLETTVIAYLDGDAKSEKQAQLRFVSMGAEPDPETETETEAETETEPGTESKTVTEPETGGTKKTGVSPQTGDNTDLLQWIAAAAGSALLLLLLTEEQKKRSQ